MDRWTLPLVMWLAGCSSGPADVAECAGEGVQQALYLDADGDGYGDAVSVVVACGPIDGHVSGGTDCDDTSPAVNPGADEVCGGQDEDCDGLSDDDDPGAVGRSVVYLDSDGDGFGEADRLEIRCAPADGFAESAGDCDPAGAGVNPGAPEVCNGIDDDCDGLVDADDNDVVDATWGYLDADGDGFGAVGSDLYGCVVVANDGDCDDTRDDIHPAQVDTCDGVDNDCTGGETGLASWVDTNGVVADMSAALTGSVGRRLSSCPGPTGRSTCVRARGTCRWPSSTTSRSRGHGDPTRRR